MNKVLLRNKVFVRDNNNKQSPVGIKLRKTINVL